MSAPLKKLPSSLSAAKPATQYRALCPLAVMSLALGALSLLTIIMETWSAWFVATLIPIGGVILGWIAIKRIDRAPAELFGRRLAQIGIWLSIGLWLFGSVLSCYLYSSAIPAGYQPITFETLWPEGASLNRTIPQNVRDMEDKKIFLRGYMQPRRQQTGIKEFILCASNGECPTCPNPSQNQLVRVKLPDDVTTEYTTRLIGVAGRFHISDGDPSGVIFYITVEERLR